MLSLTDDEEKYESGASEDMEVDDDDDSEAQAAAGRVFAKAVSGGDGQKVYSAFKALMGLCQSED